MLVRLRRRVVYEGSHEPLVGVDAQCLLFSLQVGRVLPALEGGLRLLVSVLQVMDPVALVITMDVLLLLSQEGLLLDLDLLLKLAVDALVLEVVVLVDLVLQGLVLIGVLVEAYGAAVLNFFF